MWVGAISIFVTNVTLEKLKLCTYKKNYQVLVTYSTSISVPNRMTDL